MSVAYKGAGGWKEGWGEGSGWWLNLPPFRHNGISCIPEKY